PHMYTLSLHDALPISVDKANSPQGDRAAQIECAGGEAESAVVLPGAARAERAAVRGPDGAQIVGKGTAAEGDGTVGDCRGPGARSEEHTSELQSLAYL